MKPTAENTTKHAPTCRRAFHHLDPSCARCQQLAAGAPRRRGWTDDQQRVDEIRRHDCKRSGCGPVCTFGDW